MSAVHNFATTYLNYTRKTDASFQPCKFYGKQKCLFYFTNKCSTENTLFGGKCYKHYKSYFGMNYVIMPINSSYSNIVPVSIKKTTTEPKFPIISMMKVDQDVRDIAKHLRTICGGNCDDYEIVAHFLCVMGSSINRIKPDIYYNKFKTLVLDLISSYDDFLERNSENLKLIKIAVTVSKDELTNLKNNKWLQEKINNFKSSTDEKNGSIRMFIPLIEFCIIDIINILGYKLEITNTGNANLPTCDIFNGYFVHGINYGIRNSTEGFKPTPLSETYSETEKEVVLKDKIIRTSNIDPLSLLCITSSNCLKNVDIAAFSNLRAQNNNSAELLKVQFLK